MVHHLFLFQKHANIFDSLIYANSFELFRQAIGVKEGKFMKKKIVYMDEPMGDVEVDCRFSAVTCRAGVPGRWRESHAGPEQEQRGIF
jgi:hypothetical protein